MPHRVTLFSAMLTATAAFGSTALRSMRRQYRAASEALENETVFTASVICFGLLPVALLLLALFR
jgi:hypothetical protein